MWKHEDYQGWEETFGKKKKKNDQAMWLNEGFFCTSLGNNVTFLNAQSDKWSTFAFDLEKFCANL